MAKGMSMEEFRDALASDAREENEKLKADIEMIKLNSDNKIKEMQEEIDQYKDWTIKLANRCFVQTRGLICIYCEIKICPYAYTEEEMHTVAKYMAKHKMPRNEETANKINKMLINMRYKRLNEQKERVDG